MTPDGEQNVETVKYFAAERHEVDEYSGLISAWQYRFSKSHLSPAPDVILVLSEGSGSLSQSLMGGGCEGRLQGDWSPVAAEQVQEAEIRAHPRFVRAGRDVLLRSGWCCGMVAWRAREGKDCRRRRA